MQKVELRSLALLLACQLLAGACAGVQTTPPAQPGVHAVAAASIAEPPLADGRCPAAPIELAEVRQLVDRYCVSCHSPTGAAGDDADFTHDGALSARRRNIAAKLRLHVMPPPNARQPSEAERRALSCWAKG